MSSNKPVQCLYCGADVPAEAAVCPQCRAPSHFQPEEKSPWQRRRFVVFFILVCLFCAFFAVYLPR
jgi:predicted amidophosphoribosyltransferase